MQGMQQQRPPKRAKTAGASAPKKAAPCAGQGEKKGVLGKLSRMPLAAGIASLVLLCALALPVGNLRALQNATPGAFIRQGDVRSIVSSRLTAAGNVLSATARAQGIDEQRSAVQAAVEQLEAQDTARQISLLDQALQTQVAELADAARGQLDAEGQAMLQKALDDFTEQGNFLRQEGRAYNEKAKKAQDVYEGLLLRALFAAPDRYEGL